MLTNGFTALPQIRVHAKLISMEKNKRMTMKEHHRHKKLDGQLAKWKCQTFTVVSQMIQSFGAV